MYEINWLMTIHIDNDKCLSHIALHKVGVNEEESFVT